MYDVPCQSSCYATISVCSAQSSLGLNGPYNSGNVAPIQMGSPSFSSNYRGNWMPVTTSSPRQSVWPWHPIRAGYRPQGINTGLGVSRSRRAVTTPTVNTAPTTMEEKKEEGEKEEAKSRSSRDSSSWLRVDAGDCKFLPAGGCDNWARGLAGLHNLYVSDFENRVKRMCCFHNYSRFSNCSFTSKTWSNFGLHDMEIFIYTTVWNIEYTRIRCYAWL